MESYIYYQLSTVTVVLKNYLSHVQVFKSELRFSILLYGKIGNLPIFYIINLGPISSTSLRRVFVLKTSYEVRTLIIGFHQTIELCELLTFCRIFKTNI